jgi:hypothetical protein
LKLNFIVACTFIKLSLFQAIHIMKKDFIITLFALTVTLFGTAQPAPKPQPVEKRALLIAIDKYEAPPDYVPTGTVGRSEFHNLDGCINDALSMHSVVISRFLFSPDKVDTLFNQAASRESILNKMNDLLTHSAPRGYCFYLLCGAWQHGHEYDVKGSRQKG